MSDSVRPHRRPPTRLLCLWDSPGKNTGVGCHFPLQNEKCTKMKSESEVAQSCPTLSNPMDCGLPGSSVHGIFQSRVLEWGAIAFSGDTRYWSLNSLKLTSAGLGRGKAMVGRCTNYGCSPLCTSDSEATINNQRTDIGYLEENVLFTTCLP